MYGVWSELLSRTTVSKYIYISYYGYFITTAIFHVCTVRLCYYIHSHHKRKYSIRQIRQSLVVPESNFVYGITTIIETTSSKRTRLTVQFLLIYEVRGID